MRINIELGKFGLTLLHLCAIFNEPKIARWLLENKAKINKKEGYRWKTAFHLAAYYGNLDVLTLLLEYRAKAVEDVVGCLSIHYACMGGSIEGVRLLIKEGIKVNHLSNIGTPLDFDCGSSIKQFKGFLFDG